MLIFFPTPYPDEWFYSVLCRYHLYSGITSHAATFQELAGKSTGNIGRLFPGGGIAKILGKLPAGLLDLQTVLLEHTLLPYYMRMYPLQEKKETLQQLMEGRSVSYTSITWSMPNGKSGLKYCPQCYEEDIQLYKEPYWHREHQIPLMMSCPKHGCQLVLHEFDLRRLNECFMPLSSIPVQKTGNPATGLENQLSRILSDYVSLPYFTGPTEGYNNLYLKLADSGYLGRLYSGLNTEKIFQACKNTFPTELMNQYFAKPIPAIFYRISTWKLTSPERYALLQIVAGQSTEEMFGAKLPINLDDALYRDLLELHKHGEVFRKKDVMNALGISGEKLDSIVKQYSLKPFWSKTQAGMPEKRNSFIRIALTKSEKELIEKASEQSGNAKIAVFSRHTLIKEAHQILNQKPETDSSRR